jgi:mannosyltransferase
MRRGPLLIAGVLLLALVVRLIGVTARPLWYDEAFAVLFAEKGPVLMLSGTLSPAAGVASDVHPLAYYSLLWVWIRILGESPLAVRGLSILLGLGVISAAYFLAVSLFARNLALLIALFLAFSPFQVHYAQEVRMYVLLAFFLVISTFSVWKGMDTHRWYWWALFAACAALSQYTQNLAIFYLFPLALTPLIARDWRSTKSLIFAGIAALILYLPWLLQVPAQFAKVHQAYWTTRPTPARLVTTLMSFVTNLPVQESWLPVALFVTLLVFVFAAWQTWRATRSRTPGFRKGLWLAHLSFSPVILLFLFSQWQPVFIERALLPSGVLFLLWIGWAISQTNAPKPVGRFALLILLVGMIVGLQQNIAYRGFPYGPYAKLDAYLAESVAPQDVILHSNKLTLLPSYYYNRDLPQEYVADSPGSGSDTLALPTQKVLGLLAQPSMESAVGGANRVWFIVFSRAIEEYRALGEPTHPHLSWLDAHYHLVRVEKWDDILLYVYIH